MIISVLLVVYGIILSGFTGGGVAGLGIVFFFMAKGQSENFHLRGDGERHLVGGLDRWHSSSSCSCPSTWYLALMGAALGILFKVVAKMSLVGSDVGEGRMNTIGGVPLFILEFGDELVYFTPFTLTLFILALVFTVLVLVSRPERQVEVAFGGDAY